MSFMLEESKRNKVNSSGPVKNSSLGVARAAVVKLWERQSRSGENNHTNPSQDPDFKGKRNELRDNSVNLDNELMPMGSSDEILFPSLSADGSYSLCR